MMFFALMGIATLVAWGLSGPWVSPSWAGRLRSAVLSTWPARMRAGLALALVLAGTDHLFSPERYLPMIAGFVPWAALVVAMTGACEIAGAVGLLWPPTRRAAAILLAVYFVCVFPANVSNAVNGLAVEGLPQAGWYYWLRLPFQPLVIWWALRAGEVLGRSAPRRLG